MTNSYTSHHNNYGYRHGGYGHSGSRYIGYGHSGYRNHEYGLGCCRLNRYDRRGCHGFSHCGQNSCYRHRGYPRHCR